MAVPDHPASNRRFDVDADDYLSTLGQRDPLDTMPHGSFDSSNVHSGLYDWGERKLFMRYLRDGPDAVYQYWDVGPNTWDGLKTAASKGSYVNANIAYDFQYALFGRDDFPDEGRGLSNDFARQFVTAP